MMIWKPCQNGDVIIYSLSHCQSKKTLKEEPKRARNLYLLNLYALKTHAVGITI